MDREQEIQMANDALRSGTERYREIFSRLQMRLDDLTLLQREIQNHLEVVGADDRDQLVLDCVLLVESMTLVVASKALLEVNGIDVSGLEP